MTLKTSNKHLQYPLDLFWVSDRTKYTLTLGTTTDFQEIYSMGDGVMEKTNKDEITLTYHFNEFYVEITMANVQPYDLTIVKKGEPIGFSLDSHLELSARKYSSTDYEINPLHILFTHKHQRYINAVPFATPKTII